MDQGLGATQCWHCLALPHLWELTNVMDMQRYRVHAATTVSESAVVRDVFGPLASTEAKAAFLHAHEPIAAAAHDDVVEHLDVQELASVHGLAGDLYVLR
jgi:hypothetical protein